MFTGSCFECWRDRARCRWCIFDMERKQSSGAIDRLASGQALGEGGSVSRERVAGRGAEYLLCFEGEGGGI